MKKAIQKPENWQDFESLCKKLWGEIWSIPMKIKKNGRNGQDQAGVDIYGIPKGESDYWGIQCKGKDEYVNAKLAKKEIDIEIDKAKNFKPEISVFIFATTMNKDENIEEYIREKDLESRNIGGFEILLFCWEDIADLIDENRDTYNYYVSNQQHKTKYDFEVYVGDFKNEFTISPKCVRTIKKYELVESRDNWGNTLGAGFGSNYFISHLQNDHLITLSQGKVNEAICSFEVIVANTGSVVIEDWKVRLQVLGEHKKVMDVLGTGPMGMIDIVTMKYKRTYIDGKNISYSPRDNEPLIQKDNRYFELYIIPECKEYKIEISWNVLARDFDKSGSIYLTVVPDYEDNIVYEYVDSEDQILEDEVISITTKKNYKNDSE